MVKENSKIEYYLSSAYDAVCIPLSEDKKILDRLTDFLENPNDFFKKEEEILFTEEIRKLSNSWDCLKSFQNHIEPLEAEGEPIMNQTIKMLKEITEYLRYHKYVI